MRGVRNPKLERSRPPAVHNSVTVPFESNVRTTALKPDERWSFSLRHGNKKSLEVPGIRDIFQRKSKKKKVQETVLASISKEGINLVSLRVFYYFYATTSTFYTFIGYISHPEKQVSSCSHIIAVASPTSLSGKEKETQVTEKPKQSTNIYRHWRILT